MINDLTELSFPPGFLLAGAKLCKKALEEIMEHEYVYEQMDILVYDFTTRETMADMVHKIWALQLYLYELGLEEWEEDGQGQLENPAD